MKTKTFEDLLIILISSDSILLIRLSLVLDFFINIFFLDTERLIRNLKKKIVAFILIIRFKSSNNKILYNEIY